MPREGQSWNCEALVISGSTSWPVIHGTFSTACRTTERYSHTCVYSGGEYAFPSLEIRHGQALEQTEDKEWPVSQCRDTRTKNVQGEVTVQCEADGRVNDYASCNGTLSVEKGKEQEYENKKEADKKHHWGII